MTEPTVSVQYIYMRAVPYIIESTSITTIHVKCAKLSWREYSDRYREARENVKGSRIGRRVRFTSRP